MSFDDLMYETEENVISIPEELFKEQLANRSEELFASKVLIIIILLVFNFFLKQ